MDVFHGIGEVGARLRGASVALGNFDGVHLGHQALFATARVHARRRTMSAAALTFDPHPVHVLAPALAPPLISSLSQKLRLMERLELDAAVVLPFTQALARESPESFAELLLDQVGFGELVVGFDFTYGRNREGTVDTLRRAGEARGAAVSVVPKVTVDGLPASSTKVRELLLEGRVLAAARLLDRHYLLEGTVVRGDGRGRSIGFPTANISSESGLMPAAGVYAMAALLDGVSWPAAGNIGRRPTFGGSNPVETLEVHVIGFSGDLYNRSIHVLFLDRLRPEQRFSGVDALKVQISRDVGDARSVYDRALKLPLDPMSNNS